MEFEQLTQSGLEKQEGDLLSRRRKVDAILNGPSAAHPIQFGEPAYFGVLTVHEHLTKGFLIAEDPDGGTHRVEVPDTEDPERIEEVERRLCRVWDDWLDRL